MSTAEVKPESSTPPATSGSAAVNNPSTSTTDATPTAPAVASSSSENDPFGFQQMVGEVREYFATGATRSEAWRKTQIEAVGKMITENMEDFNQALKLDLGHSDSVAWMLEISALITESKQLAGEVRGHMKKKSVSTPLALQPASSYIVNDPYGVVLVVAPWNYPLGLALSPLMGALACGNCVVVKPSEVSPNCSAVLAKWIPKYLDTKAVKVVEGAVPETQALLKIRFDYLFYTGSTAVGRLMMAAAAKHLTPVTLELGGKCPCIITPDADVTVTSRRVIWGKFMNCGQTCIAPDYLLVHESMLSSVIEHLLAALKQFFGEDPKSSSDYTRIVAPRHVQRLRKLFESADLSAEDVICGGSFLEEERYISPTIVVASNPNNKLYGEEIFGPILPILPYKSFSEAVEHVNTISKKPLALYVFTKTQAVVDQLCASTSSGGFVVNDCIVHAASVYLPFGGVGESGMGSYHGHYSLDTFSHQKSVLHKSFMLDLDLRYPPYTDSKIKWQKRLR